MAGSPNIPQGTINRLIASVVIDGFPQLNVTPSFLGPEGIGLSFGGPITTNLPSMTGVVTSPEPYQIVTCTIHLLKSQGLASLYKAQYESSSLIGTYTIRPDVLVSVGPGPWYINNGSIMNVSPLNFSGRDAGFVIELSGTYNVNAASWG